MFHQHTADALSDPERVASDEEASKAVQEFFGALSESEIRTLFACFCEQIHDPSRTLTKSKGC